MATHPIIASEFNALRDSTWLLTSFGLAGAAMQPLVSRIGEITPRLATLTPTVRKTERYLWSQGSTTRRVHAFWGRLVSSRFFTPPLQYPR